MANDISLSAAVRENLLALASTEKLISRTQSRLSTGLRVSSVIDDARVFFEAKAISDQAKDIDERKDGVDQAISSVTTALEATEAIDTLVRQLKGLLISAKTASGNELTSLEAQYNELLTQIDNLAGDANYQGLNLIEGTGQLDRPDERLARPQHHLGRQPQPDLADRRGADGDRHGHRYAARRRPVAGLEHRAAGDPTGLLEQLRQRARGRRGQAEPGRYHRGGRQPGGPADAPAARHLRPGLRRPERAGGAAALPLDRT